MTAERSDGSVRVSSDRGASAAATSSVREFTPEETGLPAAFFHHRVHLNNLSEATRYQYLVYGDGETLGPGDEPAFRTAGPGAFSFLAFGDSGTGGTAQRRLAARMLLEQVSLAVHTGDVAYMNGSFEQFLNHHFDVYRDLLQRVPLFPSLGNHEYYTADAAPYLALHETPTAGVPASDLGRYYSFDWGNVHFVALDSNRPLREAARGSGAMLRWLEDDLRATTKFWKIVYFHHPPYAWGPNSGDSLSALVREHVVPILERHGVQVVLDGHEHSYQRSLPILRGEAVPEGEGIVYLTTGGGGGGLYPVHPHPLLAAGAIQYHYLRVTVEGSRLIAVAVGPDGGELDRCVVAPVPELSAGGLVNAASFQPRLAPGALASVFGRNLAPEARSAGALPLPIELGGIRAFADGKPLPLWYVSPVQINAQLPFDVSGRVEVRIETPNGGVGGSAFLSVTAPGILALAHPDGRPVSEEAPAPPGAQLVLYAAGLGAVNGPIQAGQPAPFQPLLRTLEPVIVNLDGAAIEPSFAGLTPGWAGLYQVNFRVPEHLGPGRYVVSLRSAGATSNAAVLYLRTAS
jgi:uncharacterized protein (TIGR03437 family)